MPELPEVEQARSLVERCLQGKSIKSVNAREAGGGPRDGSFDDKVVGEGVTEKGLVAALKGKKVTHVCRKGKQMWIELGGGASDASLLFHLGMTGSIVVKGEARASYQSFKVDEAFPPRFTKLTLTMHDGTELAFCDPRRFG